ncbi:MAG: hypothetical protein LBT15_06375, partial [Synergistaceae bacterium]|nr:hypothetical protein [Synergistaceae bacterium]
MTELRGNVFRNGSVPGPEDIGAMTMMTDTVLKDSGMKYLTEKLGMVDAERFIALVIKEPFDY